MNLFISWSGDKSYAVAETLRDWIPKVIQAIKPFLSKTDINKGTQWREEIRIKLEDAHAGIFCLTNDNLNSNWLHFDAGAISMARNRKAYVCTYLLDIASTDVIYPLAQFQHTLANKEETKMLMKTLNSALQENNLPGILEENVLDDSFETYWPKMEESLKHISSTYENHEQQIPERPVRDILVEILSLVRSISKEFYYKEPTLGDLLAGSRGRISRNALGNVLAGKTFSVKTPEDLENTLNFLCESKIAKEDKE